MVIIDRSGSVAACQHHIRGAAGFGV